MSEVDVFERSLAAAFLRLADDVPGTVDAAAVARRVALDHPRRPAHAFARSLVAVPRLAWVLLLLAALLAAMVGATLLAGSQPEQKHPAVLPPVGQVFACPAGSNPDKPGPVGQSRPHIGDGIAAMAFDRHAGRIVVLAQLLSGVETWTFDVCTNTWTRMRPDREPVTGDSEVTSLVYDVDSDATIANDGQNIWVYLKAANTWTRMATTPVVRQWTTLTWTYDPVSGLVIAADAGDLWSYAVETDSWAWVSSVPWWAGHGALAYDASVDRIVAYGRDASGQNNIWLFDIHTRAWSASRANIPTILCGMGWPNPGVIYDEAARRTVVSCTQTIAYDAAADRWESLTVAAGDFPFSVYDAANNRFVGLDNGDSVVAFDLATRSRIVLLAPSGGQPTPSIR